MGRSKTSSLPPVAPEIEQFASLTASGGIQVIKATSKKKYGFTPTDAYCSDLIAFIEALTDGQQGA